MNQIDRLLNEVSKKKGMARRHGDAVIQMRAGWSWTTRTVRLVEQYFSEATGADGA